MIMLHLINVCFRQICCLMLIMPLSWAAFAQKPDNPEIINTEIFETSTRHWYEFFTDDYVISPLPGKPQYDGFQIEAIGDNILLFQRDNGGWPKNYDMTAILSDTQKAKLKAVKSVPETTFDNSSTHTQVLYLAQAYTITKLERFKEGCLKGLDFILAAQYENGGWPQYYPPRPENNTYSTHITFNDGGYMGIMNVLKRIKENDPNFGFVGKQYHERATEAYTKGLECILKTQIIENDRKKIWCQQHDTESLAPTWARTFEPPSLCNQESAPIVTLLMDIDDPSEEIISSIQGAVAWFSETKILNTRCIDDPTATEYVSEHKVHYIDRRVVYDVLAPPIWSRYSELETGKPIFCDRSSEIVYYLGDLSRERRSGYRWYTYAPQEVLDKYPEWQKRWAPGNNVLASTK